MCVMCYFSTDCVIEDIPFDENDRKFNVQRIEERSCHLTRQFVYYCGSSLGCGCGFGDTYIMEDILHRTDQEFQNGKLTDATIWLWWNQSEPPPENKEEFDKRAEKIRASRRDTVALYRLIEKTCKAGFDCEILVSWAGDENNPIYETFFVHAEHEQINVNFRAVWNEAQEKVLLYHFAAL